MLAGAWWLWSGHTEPMMIAFGVGSILLVLWVFKRMDDVAEDKAPYRLGLRPIFYLPYIIWEIVKANIDVAKVIVSPSLPISPRVFRAKISQKTSVAQVIYANSITLTPGTITLDLRDGEVLVHALTDDTAEGILEGSMDARCAKLEGSG